MEFIFSQLDESLPISQIHKKVVRINEFIRIYNEKVGNITTTPEMETEISQWLAMYSLILKYFGDINDKIYYHGYLHFNIFEGLDTPAHIFSYIHTTITFSKFKTCKVSIPEVIEYMRTVDAFNRELSQRLGIAYNTDYDFYDFKIVPIMEKIVKYGVDIVLTDHFDFVMLKESVGNGILERGIRAIEENDRATEIKLGQMIEQLYIMDPSFVEIYIYMTHNIDIIYSNYGSSAFYGMLKTLERTMKK